MAQITITVPDTAIIRIQAAFGKNGIPATTQEVINKLQLMIKRTVLDFEAQSIRNKADSDINALQF